MGDATETGTKMNSLYQIRSTILHGKKVIILGGKIEKELARIGCEVTTFTLEDEGANHHTMDPR